MNSSKSAQISRPFGISALSIFFFIATGITFVAAFSLLFPNGLLEPIWKLNPRARVGLGGIGIWAALIFAVALACVIAAVGQWRGARCGYLMAISIMTINSLADLFNVVSRKRAEGDNRNTGRHLDIGIPIQSKGETIFLVADRLHLVTGCAVPLIANDDFG